MTSDHTWDLFLAHAGPDGLLAKQLFDLLDSKLRVFLDTERLMLGDNWDASLATAQEDSLVTVVLVSSRTEKAYYQREEIAAAIAMAREDPETHRVVPVYVRNPGEDIYIPYGLRLKHSLTLSDTLTLNDAAEKLIDLVRKLRSSDTSLSHQSTVPSVTRPAPPADGHDWNAMLREAAAGLADRDRRDERFAAPIASAICVSSSLPDEMWQKTRETILRSLTESVQEGSSEFEALLLKAVCLRDASVAAKLIGDSRDLLVDRPGDSTYTRVTRGEVRSLLTLRDTRKGDLRVGLDAWPGYFPLFAIEKELADRNIHLFNVESSKVKVRLLKEGRLDLVATTPGCLFGPNSEGLPRLRAVAIINESSGADQIVIRGSNWSKKDRQWPPTEELAGATWIVTAGSTSELFARAFCREIKITVPPERWVCTLDYQDALEEMKLRQGVTVCSTWEPYSSWMLERDDAIQVMCTTRELDPLVVDCLVASKDANRATIDDWVARLLSAWDDCLASRCYLEPARVAAVCERFVRLDPTDYHRMLEGVRYLSSTEMKRMAVAGEFSAVCDRVCSAWGNSAAASPAHTPWQGLIHHASRWLAGDPVGST